MTDHLPTQDDRLRAAEERLIACIFGGDPYPSTDVLMTLCAEEREYWRDDLVNRVTRFCADREPGQP